MISNNLHLFKLHDFGCRGVSSVESAGIGGLGHLVNFLGTDTMAALVPAEEYYAEYFAEFSVPASEHRTMTSCGREGEPDAMRNMLEKHPEGIVARVSDSCDIYRALRKCCGTLLIATIEQRDG